MCDALAKAGVDTLIVTTNADGDRTLDVPIGKPTAWRGVPALFFNRDFSESFKYSFALARWLRRHVTEFDVVHIHAVLSHTCLSAASACRTHRVPYILRPLGTLAPWSLRQKAFRKRVTLALGARRAILAAGAVHCTSDEECRGVEQAFPGVNGVVIPLGIEDAFFDKTPPGGAERNGDPYVLALSRIHPKKNLEALIVAFLAAAAGQRDRWRLVIAGDGEPHYVEQLRQFATQGDGDHRVTFAGWVDGAQKHALIQRASLFALASLHENFGVSVLEALASGVPAILSGEVDLAGAVRQHAAGWVVEPTVGSIRAGLADAFSNPVERLARGGAARRLAGRFAWPGIASEIVELYLRLRPGGAPAGHPILSSATTAGH
jgi:glycosyltransferase involved in cell wall biosynthesis